MSMDDSTFPTIAFTTPGITCAKHGAVPDKLLACPQCWKDKSDAHRLTTFAVLFTKGTASAWASQARGAIHFGYASPRQAGRPHPFISFCGEKVTPKEELWGWQVKIDHKVFDDMDRRQTPLCPACLKGLRGKT